MNIITAGVHDDCFGTIRQPLYGFFTSLVQQNSHNTTLWLVVSNVTDGWSRVNMMRYTSQIQYDEIHISDTIWWDTQIRHMNIIVAGVYDGCVGTIRQPLYGFFTSIDQQNSHNRNFCRGMTTGYLQIWWDTYLRHMNINSAGVHGGSLNIIRKPLYRFFTSLV